jgi:ArsR family transcriptional regulator, arsenate/arsenite/antimonite-responsive transcriptional repressor
MTMDKKPDMDHFIAITKALSDPHRVRALLALRKGEMCVCQIIELFGLAPSTVSKHMSILKQSGLVDNRKDSRWVYYRLVEDAKRSREINELIKLTISLLELDEQILSDDTKMDEITTEGLEILCKRQRNSGD